MLLKTQNILDLPMSLNQPLEKGLGSLILVLVAWEMVWKGIALYRAARNEETGWFVALFLLNTVGILPILYIYLFAKDLKKK